jgi:Cdc6-like AAA superfamily ATPase
MDEAHFAVEGKCLQPTMRPSRRVEGTCSMDYQRQQAVRPAVKPQKITPGVYEIQMSQSIGIFFERVPVLTRGLLRFPRRTRKGRSRNSKVLEKRKTFSVSTVLTHKRGIIMWGPPGSGKSCTIQLIMQDVVDRKGVVVKIHPHPRPIQRGYA